MENKKTKRFNLLTGAKGEKTAKNYVKKSLKYKVLATNYKNALGEIDIIAYNKGEIIFIEVKTKTTLDFGRPSEAVTSKKQHKIRSVATLYLKEKELLTANVRFDVIEILPNEINHIPHAF